MKTGRRRRVRNLYGLRTDIEERHRQVKCFWDLTRFQSTAWSLVVNQLVFVCLTYSLLQLHLLRQGHQELNRRTRPTSRRLLPDGDRVIIYRQQCFGFFTLLEHMEMTLSLEGRARRRALAKTRSLMQDRPPRRWRPPRTRPPCPRTTRPLTSELQRPLLQFRRKPPGRRGRRTPPRGAGQPCVLPLVFSLRTS